jgi:hypothetical protein
LDLFDFLLSFWLPVLSELSIEEESDSEELLSRFKLGSEVKLHLFHFWNEKVL